MSAGSSARSWLGLAGLVGLVAVGQWLWAGRSSGPDDAGIPPIPREKPARPGDRVPIESWRKVYDAFPPIDRCEVDTADVAGASMLDGESILGVEIDGEARAYPLNLLGRPGREVVNDSLAGRPIAVTFCGVCRTPLVFSRRVAERTLTFYVSGVLVNANMLLRDAETRSGWVQLLGRAIEGPLKGKSLDRVASTWTEWKTWRATHPSTTVIRLDRGTTRNSPAPTRSAGAHRQASLGTLQWGLAEGGHARSWPFAGLAEARAIDDSFAGRPLLLVFEPEWQTPAGFDRRVDGQVLAFRRRDGALVDEASGSTWDPATGRAIAGPFKDRKLDRVEGIVAIMSTWRAFHPDGETWTARSALDSAAD